MIALADGMPLVELENGSSVAFEPGWLVRVLVRAAAEAGYPKWWLAEHVSESVAGYLALQWGGNVVTLEQLREAMQSALDAVGYSEVGAHLVLGVPGVRFSLVPLVFAAGTGYELAFFEQLGRRVQEILERGVTFLEIEGLTPCVKALRSRKVWSRDCEILREEIVEFVRACTLSAEAEVQVRMR